MPASRMRVWPMCPRPRCPYPVTRPLSSTSIQARVVGEADGAGLEEALQVVEPVGRRQVVVGDAQLEGQLHHPLDGFPGIHDTEVTDDSIRTLVAPTPVGPSDHGASMMHGLAAAAGRVAAGA